MQTDPFSSFSVAYQIQFRVGRVIIGTDPFLDEISPLNELALNTQLETRGTWQTAYPGYQTLFLLLRHPAREAYKVAGP